MWAASLFVQLAELGRNKTMCPGRVPHSLSTCSGRHPTVFPHRENQTMFAVLKSLNREQRSAFLASFLGWTLDAFDFFLLTFVIADIAKDFSTGIPAVAEAIPLTLAMRPVGAFVFGLLAERFGRKPALMFDIVFYSAMELATAFSTSIEMLLVLRALFGIGMGGEWGLGAALALETVAVQARGLVSGILQQGYAVGNLLAAILYWTVYDSIGWRGMFVVGVAPA